MSRQSSRMQGTAMPPSASGRQNEYFVPRDGIDREVISADICRYLGNDALVRPGHYENPQTGHSVQGYYITAYRNLTTAMIEDLKADSARWDHERRAQTSSRNSAGGSYRASETHQMRQHQGPSSESNNYSQQPDPYARDASYDTPRYPGSGAPGYSGAAPTYQQQFAQPPIQNPQQVQPPQQQQAYGGGYTTAPPPQAGQYGGFQQQQSPTPDAMYRGPSQTGPPMGQGFQEPFVTTGAHIRAEQRPVPASYGQGPPPPGSSYGYPPHTSAAHNPGMPHPVDPFHGRAGQATAFSNQGPQYDDGTHHRTSAPAAKPPTPQGGSSGRRTDRDRDRDRERDRDSDRHHRSSRR